MNHEIAIKTAANIYVATIEFLANKHSVTMSEIIDALRDGNEKIRNQMAELIGSASDYVKAA